MSNSFLDKQGLMRYTAKILERISNISSGVTSFKSRTGAVTPQTGDYSVSMVTGAAPKESPVFTGTISLGRESGTAVGDASFAVGLNVEASGTYSHAEGDGVDATGQYAHAEGYFTTASGIASHSEGSGTHATGDFSHTEGSGTYAYGAACHSEGIDSKAFGTYTHAEGMISQAFGQGSHAEGNSAARGDFSHAEGYDTSASNYASHVSGKYNKQMTDGASYNTLVGDVFVVGNGVGVTDAYRSNAFRIAYNGTVYATSQYMTTGADYAEYFEWLDGNPNSEDRVGHFVTLEGNKIKIAEPGDYILGVISGQPCVIGNADEDWLGRWEHDDFNRFVKEYLVHNEVEVFPPESITEDELQLWLTQNHITERDGHYYQTTTQVVDYPTTSWRHKANPAYDPSQPYIERKDRQEWDAVGMVGVLSVLDDGSCIVNGYAKVSNNGVAVSASRHDTEDSWRVIDRVTTNVVKIVFTIK